MLLYTLAVWLIIATIGLLLGIAVGRWAVIGPVAFGVWVYAVVPPDGQEVAAALAATLPGLVGVAAGLALRRRLQRRGPAPRPIVKSR